MKIKHVEVVREIIGPEKLLVLTDVFRNCTGKPPVLQAARYRADHPQWLDILDEFANNKFLLDRDSDYKNYRVRVYALGLIEDRRADELLELMNNIFQIFKTLYVKHLSDLIPLPKIIDLIGADSNQVREALFYMRDAHDVWSGVTNSFPYGDNAAIGISESVLRKNNFGDVISEFYEWHFINARSRVHALETGAGARVAQEPRGFFGEVNVTAEPEWYKRLDDNKKALIKELDIAVRNGLVALPTMGLRTLIESIMRDKVGGEGSFNDSLKAFRRAGYVTDQHAELIDRVIEAGHASIHRMHFPNETDVLACLDVVKHLIEGVYILRPKVNAVAENTPKRKSQND